MDAGNKIAGIVFPGATGIPCRLSMGGSLLFNYTMVQLYNGAMMQWYNGTMIQLYNGTIIQWYNYAMIQ